MQTYREQDHLQTCLAEARSDLEELKAQADAVMRELEFVRGQVKQEEALAHTGQDAEVLRAARRRCEELEAQLLQVQEQSQRPVSTKKSRACVCCEWLRCL